MFLKKTTGEINRKDKPACMQSSFYFVALNTVDRDGCELSGVIERERDVKLN